MIDAAHVGWLDVTVRLLVAVAVGAVVGVEREADGKDAGVRTHMLLALGAATFGLVSVGGFSDFVGEPGKSNVTVDVSRVASYVAAGIGFLGGGTILKGDDRIHGLTTAASLWVVAAAGLAAGLGFVSAALVAGGVATVVLLADRPLHALVRRIRGVESED